MRQAIARLILDVLMAAFGGILLAKPLPMVSAWHAALAGMGVLFLYRACLVVE